MKLTTHFVITIVALGLAVFSLTGCGGTGSDSASAPEKTKIVLGTTGTTPGWVQQGDNGLEGFDIDLMKEIAKRNNWEVEWKQAELQALFGMLDNGQINTIANCIAINPERQKKYDFSSPYVYSQYVFVTKKGNVANDLSYFNGKKISCNGPGDERLSLLDLIKEKNLNAEVVPMDSEGPAMMALVNGTVDAVFCGIVPAGLMSNELNLEVEVYKPNYKMHKIAYPFKKEENSQYIEGINKALKEMRKDGTLAKISEKWFHVDLTTEPGSNK